MEIKVEYKDKDLNVIYSETIDFSKYCEIMSKKILSILYKIDDFNNNKIKYDEVKKYIFNIAGSINRIPDNIEG